MAIKSTHNERDRDSFIESSSTPNQPARAVCNPDGSDIAVSTKEAGNTEAAVTNGADGTYSYYIDMDGYKYLGLQLILNGGSGTVTVTIEATMQDDGTAAASCTYYDVTSDAYGSASFTATNFLIDDAGYFANAKYVKVKVVASTGAADDADWTIYSKKLY